MTPPRDPEGDTDFGAFGSIRSREMMISVAEFGNLLKAVESLQRAERAQEVINVKAVAVQERHQEKISNLETDVGKLYVVTAKLEKDQDRWIQRGTAAWVVILVLWALFQFFGPKFIPSLGG